MFIAVRFGLVIWTRPSKHRLFELFISILDLLIQNARIEGNLDSGIVDMKANVIELQGTPKVNTSAGSLAGFTNLIVLISFLLQTVHMDQMSGASTVLFTFTLDRGITWEVIFSFQITSWMEYSDK
jgi:hypothetical protein